MARAAARAGAVNRSTTVELEMDERDPQDRRIVYRVLNAEMHVTLAGDVAATIRMDLAQSRRLMIALQTRIAQLEHQF